MDKYYNPSEEELKIKKNIEEKIIEVTKKRFHLKDSITVKFNYQDGLHFERMSQGKDVSITIRDRRNSYKMRILVQRGVLISYTYDGVEKFVSTLKEIKNNSVNVPTGYWVEYYEEEISATKETKIGNTYEEDDIFERNWRGESDGYSQDYVNSLLEKKHQRELEFHRQMEEKFIKGYFLGSYFSSQNE